MTHIGKESTFQTIHHLRFITRLNQFGFSFFQFCNIIIDTDDFYFIFLRFIVSDHHITTHPIPFILRSGTTNTHLTLKMPSFSVSDFIIKIKETLTIFRVHMGINTHNLIQKRIFLLT